MGYKIDLHGKDSIEATTITQNALFSLQENDSIEYLDIIVGNGEGIVKHSVLEIIEENGNYYEFPYPKLAMIRVYKK